MTRPEPAAVPRGPARGLHRLWDPRVWGTIVGAAGATVFVLANRGGLGDPWPSVALLAWTVAFVIYAWLVFVRERTFGASRPVSPRAGLVYLGSVVGMLVLIRIGTALLDGAGRGGLRPAVIVVAVGLHFLPFAAAFHTPMFTVLGSIMAAVGAVGLTLGLAWDERAAAAAAVVTGVVMLVVIAVDAGRPRRVADPDMAGGRLGADRRG